MKKTSKKTMKRDKNLTEFARESWEYGTEFKLYDGSNLEGDDDKAVKDALTCTPFNLMIDRLTRMEPKIDDDGYFGADFHIIDLNGASYPVEVFVHAGGVMMFFREP